MSKDSKEALAQDFEPILDGRGVNLKIFMGQLPDLRIDDVVEGTKVCLHTIHSNSISKQKTKTT